MWLFFLVVLATFNRVQQVVSIDGGLSTASPSIAYFSSIDSNDINSSDSLDNRISRPDPTKLVEIEKNLLSLLGFKKRPVVDRSKIVIPEAMKKLYAQITGHKLDSFDTPKADIHNKDANTIRSYTHEGEFRSQPALLTSGRYGCKFKTNCLVREIHAVNVAKLSSISLNFNFFFFF